jgi:sorbitol-6-phosphate 2-dehydrogenase
MIRLRDYHNLKVPLGREVTLEEIGSVLVSLCSDQASYMAGQAINITGGQEMRCWPLNSFVAKEEPS